ncbi:MAG: hypothetical protein U1C97_02150, partial [Candidatus Gracilibacteria bacterium]|nr:hypothetical protein [Candidatus Gracilibacteria bacterium]
MAFFQWMWRGVLILVGIVVLIGFYLLMLQGVNLVTRLIQFPRGFVLSPQVEMLDPVLGLVHIVHQIDPVLTREGIDLTYTADDYPLTLRLCLQGLEGFYRHELDCI